MPYDIRPAMQCTTANYKVIGTDSHSSQLNLAVIENKRPSFYAGSRYGRSQYIEPADASSSFQVAPRRDYHFLRYGKRSDELEETSRATIKCYENVRGFVLTCSFTGIQDYYRCWKG